MHKCICSQLVKNYLRLHVCNLRLYIIYIMKVMLLHVDKTNNTLFYVISLNTTMGNC